MSEQKSFDSVDGAKLLLAIANEKGQILNNTKLQKLLYIIYSYFLSQKNRQIFTETPKAWPYGPVFPRTRKKVDLGVIYRLNSPDLEDISKDLELVEMCNGVIDRYSKYTATQLSEWSHLKGSPWHKTTQHEDFKWGDFIPDEYIKEYFSNLTV